MKRRPKAEIRPKVKVKWVQGDFLAYLPRLDPYSTTFVRRDRTQKTAGKEYSAVA